MSNPKSSKQSESQIGYNQPVAGASNQGFAQPQQVYTAPTYPNDPTAWQPYSNSNIYGAYPPDFSYNNQQPIYAMQNPQQSQGSFAPVPDAPPYTEAVASNYNPVYAGDLSSYPNQPAPSYSASAVPASVIQPLYVPPYNGGAYYITPRNQSRRKNCILVFVVVLFMIVMPLVLIPVFLSIARNNRSQN